jgi:hypothetical protein
MPNKDELAPGGMDNLVAEHLKVKEFGHSPVSCNWFSVFCRR